MEYAVAVFDIGMTNKKVAIYDEGLQQLEVSYKNFPPRMYPVGDIEVETHDLGAIKTWFFGELKKFAARYPIKAIAVATHGATFVCLDEAGKVCIPCIFYTYEPGEELHRAFYRLAGDKKTLQRTTFTPPLSSMINPAKGILFLQKNLPDQFAKVRTLLNYPQYWAYELTGLRGIEPTYIGCHTYLWDHSRSTYSPITDALGIRALLPEDYKNSYEPLGHLLPGVSALTGLPESTIVTMGIHDSNASLLPYLVKEGDNDFVLNSTGTWCVRMHPQETLEFNPGDIGNIVFFNQSAFRQPVKTSIFLGGMELDTYIGLYKKINAVDAFPPYDPGAFRQLLEANDTYLLPELVSGSGQFNTSRPGILERGVFYPFAEISEQNTPQILRNGPLFWALLDTSLVIQTMVALERAGLKEGMRIYTEGGFRQNQGYNTLLASALPGNKLYLTNLKEATSFGAAITAIMAYTNKTSVPAGSVNIEYIEILKEPFPHFAVYKEKWLAAAGAAHHN
jgi:sugar (pentulose or hexulose) kinase